jgi:hypothetical protein
MQGPSEIEIDEDATGLPRLQDEWGAEELRMLG